MIFFKRKKQYEWDGCWETDYHFSEFHPRKEIVIRFIDQLSDSYTPSKAQIQAVSYLINNQEAIYNAICHYMINRKAQLCEMYDRLLPELNTIAAVKKHIKINAIVISTTLQNKIAHIGYLGSCSWDANQGIACYLHKQEVLYIATPNQLLAHMQNTTSNTIVATSDAIPKQYTPHHIYNLKPSQEAANNAYYYLLIERSFNQQFIAHFEEGDIATETRTSYTDMSFLQTACAYNNEILVDYILSHKPVDTTGCIKSAAYNLNLSVLKKLIAYGVDINEKDEISKEYLIEHIIGAITKLSQQNASKNQLKKGITILKWAIKNNTKPIHTIKHSKKLAALDTACTNMSIKNTVREVLLTSL